MKLSIIINICKVKTMKRFRNKINYPTDLIKLVKLTIFDVDNSFISYVKIHVWDHLLHIDVKLCQLSITIDVWNV